MRPRTWPVLVAVQLWVVVAALVSGQGLPLPETLSPAAAVRVLAADWAVVSRLPPTLETAPRGAEGAVRLPFDDGPRARRDKETKDRFEVLFQVRAVRACGLADETTRLAACALD